MRGQAWTEAEEMAAQRVRVLITGASRGLDPEMVKHLVETLHPGRKLLVAGTYAVVRVLTSSVTQKHVLGLLQYLALSHIILQISKPLHREKAKSRHWYM